MRFDEASKTLDRLVERFAWRNGRLASQGAFCRLANRRPDGMAFDAAGKLWVCTPGTGGLDVFAPDGAALRRTELRAGAMTTHCCFAARGSATSTSTAAGRGSVLNAKAAGPGLPLWPHG